MAKTILSDPALTQRVLRLANSAMYSVFGQSITTISKAAMVLGVDSIGHLALRAKLIDSPSAANAGSPHTRIEMEKSLLAGHIARKVASLAVLRDAEEAVVCAMLHGLGRLLVAFYLPEHWESVQERYAQQAGRETAVVRDILGMGLDEIGSVIAQQWKLPSELVDTMRSVTPQPPASSLPRTEWIAALSTMCMQCATMLSGFAAQSGAASVSGILSQYAGMLELDAAALQPAAAAALRASEEDQLIFTTKQLQSTGQASNGKWQDNRPRAVILMQGVQEMRSAASKASTRQLITATLEATYQGLELSRAVAFIHCQEQAQYTARICVDDAMQELLLRLAFSDTFQPDVFHAALAADKIIFVEDAHAPAFVGKLPKWWRSTLSSARGFVVLPIVADRHPLGFIYGDWENPAALNRLNVSEIKLLDQLRAYCPLDAAALSDRADLIHINQRHYRAPPDGWISQPRRKTGRLRAYPDTRKVAWPRPPDRRLEKDSSLKMPLARKHVKRLQSVVCTATPCSPATPVLSEIIVTCRCG